MKKYMIPFLPLIIAVSLAGIGIFGVFQAKSFLAANSAEFSHPVILIDAGHGGMDGGATSVSGLLEKEINLSIALKLRDLLTASGYSVVLTRDSDRSIHSPEATTIREMKVSDIHNRLKLMEEYPGCIFVSIHQNHYSESKYRGAQFFYSVNDPSSKRLADVFQKTVCKMLQPENTREIKPCGTEIYLMAHAKTTAVLAECGFLSNSEEASLLSTEDYQGKMAFALFSGIVHYFEQSI